MILTANDSRPKKLGEDILAERESRLTYASGNLVLWSRTAKFVNGSDTFTTASILKLSICNSAAALFGATAVEATKAIDVYEGMQLEPVEGATITQAYQFVGTEYAELSAAPLPQLADSKTRFALARAAGVCDPISQDVVRLETDAITERRAPSVRGPVVYASIARA
ncbi:hypothetical protein LMTR13_26355 [Bradyrhizobium icense]|uniref:Uncharacterized protein n=2 Tax=Bradyrhizobium icense TaxID=1274631 RepID=A0A1B1UK95_9BRAD|nr:hypothetical protein LMTR13_26355 [Bradyrhizobium icense]